MASRNRIPPALEPYLRLPPEAALILFTSTLGCSANWLTSRLVSASLSSSDTTGTDTGGNLSAVIFANFVRETTFWQSELKRTTGLDITRLERDGRFASVDCFTRKTESLDSIADSISEAVKRLQQRQPLSKVLLVLDNPDVLIATGAINARDMGKWLLRLRSQVHSAAVVCNADQPLLAAAVSGGEEARYTPLETESAALITTLAHEADFVISVRELDTGAARDVSGVVRISRGGGSGSGGGGGGGSRDAVTDGDMAVKEMEALYLVQRDGAVKVFERGMVP